jgi:hypothetical protein
VTNPFALTLATDALLDVQPTGTSRRGAPSASNTIAVSVCEPFGGRITVDGVIWIDDARAVKERTATEPPRRALMMTVPGYFVVRSPDGEIVATTSSSLSHVTGPMSPPVDESCSVLGTGTGSSLGASIDNGAGGEAGAVKGL